MNYLFLNWRDLKNPRSGGAEVVTEEIIKRLVQKGNHVTLFTSSFKDCLPEETTPEGYTIVRKGSEFTVHVHAFLHWHRHFKQKGFDVIVDQFHGIPFFTPLYVKSRKSKVESQKSNHLSTLDFKLSTPSSPLSTLDFPLSTLDFPPSTPSSPLSTLDFKLSTPSSPLVVAFIHEVAREIWLRMYPFPIGRIGYTLEPLFFKPYRHTHFITVSNATKRDLKTMKIPDESISIIPEAVTVAPLTRQPKKDSIPTIIFVGRIAKMKGVADLLKAYTLTKKHIPDLHIWLVGGGDEYKKQLEEQYATDKDVTFFGFVDEAKKLELLERATILASASMKEGFGLVVIEAAAMYTPSVVYNVDGFNEAVIDGKTGILTATNPQALGEAMLTLLQNPTLYRTLQQNAHKRSHHFNFEQTTEEFEKIITSDGNV